jgi:phage gpG-like protein
MPGIHTNIDFAELRKVSDAFKARGGNLQSVTEVIAQDLVAAVEERFQTESGHQQGPWKKLSASTIRRMRSRRRRSSVKILQDTGRLAGSITPYHDGLIAEAFTNVKYAKYHTSSAPRSKIPLRDFFDIDFVRVMEDTAELLMAEVIPG